MQIKGLHKNIYKLYAYSRTQECLDVYRKKYEDKVSQWEKLVSEGVSLKTAQEILGFSRSTFYKMKKTLKDLKKGISPPSKRPKKLNQPRWGEAELQLVLKVRRENLTYGKEKIATNCFHSYLINIIELKKQLVAPPWECQLEINLHFCRVIFT